ncbi:MAG: hypothetical protein AUG50_06705 [Betaproteobacteria bacterium 13_1_20CM_3_63_8]|nr:MAG: hypothetical protein AUG50_06705 [Betaproteobacteria bacterium 13_1_20CM_3_63_8]
MPYWFIAQLGVDHEPRAIEGTQGPRGHAAQLLVLHHQEKALEDGGRLALEELLVRDFQKLAAHLEALVQELRRRVGRRREARLEVLQQDGV